MFIKREIDLFLSKRMFSGKVVVVYGPRQSGKTTSIEHYISENGLYSLQNREILLKRFFSLNQADNPYHRISQNAVVMGMCNIRKEWRQCV